MSVNTSYRLPAEWEPQSAILLAWPHDETDWLPYLNDITATYLLLTRMIAEREQVIICTPEPYAVGTLLGQQLPKALIKRITLVGCPTNDTWCRDLGPITLVGNGEQRLLDFRFNGWGEKFAAALDNEVTRTLHAAGVLRGTLESHLDFVLEGGAIESDGQGTILTTACCLLAPHRNQPLNQAEIEAELKRRLHAERILWLDHGQLLGDDTDGHIDTLARFAPADTIVFQGCQDPDDAHFGELQLMKKQLQTLRTPQGKPYRLLELPLPRALFDEQERLPATYANFLVINGAVICPTYGDRKNDEQALAVLAQAFPQRDILPLDARTIVRQHGSIHCLTMQLPDIKQ